ncbi:alpha-glucuronidase family glycosyl hydrolase [Halalkalibacterium halodurans]|uniref:Xylan alpha-1,2-glucuronidase n=1 Tax=Halalkalibacterium halodurans (strain ATCC BAA-125 / DSM 18197 / FERM 7344 / JCM 9153 / C-125) TaxID=272558 RepID=Q9KE00_HALH5|nr:alpha-glucuronidase family glycosyl hydrolase [Halalkalibacterium halodurans]MED4079264.1 alpha-glucuronidase family glycosyl hydrolase [Halalkalibacterium halodurans]MED4085335.1 alpha-glucuronidase family glycosyl hydrolase [Halalkalibacterium halodurans]MED4105371.1 alpha-glucuronidase family glycosyl hydrolase [Halalkalibacterium halodurans]MED4108218.1 alpha-glucuronidase family glycosyl hydrolase [Halalkalibacterium halodurans]MED4124097.1 alpha-glucuronidase family glycosyl hydrolase
MNRGETGYETWLRYEEITDSALHTQYRAYFQTIEIKGNSPIIESAKEELMQGLRSLLGVTPKCLSATGEQASCLIGTIADVAEVSQAIKERLREEGYAIYSEKGRLVLVGKTETGVLYGTFHLLRLLQMRDHLHDLRIVENPRNQLRMINEWDNMDGSIERGYAGGSIFFEHNKVTNNLQRIKDYARILSSIGINAIAFNNVNVHEEETKLITRKFLPDVAKVANIFRQYGIKTFLSINYASPIQLGKLETADPLDEKVRAWWKETVADIYRYIPDFGGFLVKADSEHRPGPFTYGRNHAEGANMLAEALAPFGGIVLWRCFVYNCLQDWRDRKTDRARAAYDHFKPLDGLFHDNVVLQIKNGPMDFQVREPVSPLFGAMPKTNQMLEFQITQEYTGQQKHLCYLVPQWKEILDFDTFANGKESPVKSIVDGSQYDYKVSGITAVSNVGNDENWTGHLLAQANLYGYGRLTWNPNLSTEEVTTEWTRATFGDNEEVIQTIHEMLLQSWLIYESYTAPLGVGWMVEPGHHYGPNVDGYEYSVWGTYHYADCHGIGVDRTVATGTGYTAQYFAENYELYEHLETCPDSLLLFFHHVPYTHKLKSGVTVIQHIYDTHFSGAEQAEQLLESWRSLEGKVDSERFQQVLERLEHQAEHAKEWRDVINTYFYRKSGIPDEKKRTIYPI